MTRYGCLRPRPGGPGDEEHSGGHTQEIPESDTGHEDRVGSLLRDPRSKLVARGLGRVRVTHQAGAPLYAFSSQMWDLGFSVRPLGLVPEVSCGLGRGHH